jgi:hypothetical protein
MFIIVELLYGIQRNGKRKRERNSISDIIKHNICEGRGYKDVY